MPDVTLAPERPSRIDPDAMAAAGRGAMISTSHPAATDAGLSIMRRGGSAVDAYLAAAAVQTVVEPTMTSLAGGFGITVYEPATRTCRIVGAAGALPEGQDGNLDVDERDSGRTVVPPAWVAGAHAAWSRWGKLAWSDLFADALACARDGFVVDRLLWGTIWEGRMAAGRYPEGRAVFYPGGELVGPGDLLRQPALARTIEGIAAAGPPYVLEGEFAQQYVALARAHGGRLTLEDMAATQAREVEPPPAPIAGGFELRSTGYMYALALSAARAGGLAERPHPTEDGETLYLTMRLVQETWHRCLEVAKTSGLSMDTMDELLATVSPESAEALWPEVTEGSPRPFEAMNVNTCGIVAVDDCGTVAYGAHSTSSTPFGAGFMVDGVVVPRPLYYFANPVAPMPAGLATSMLVTRDGEPVFVAASPSISTFEAILQNALNVLEWGIGCGDSVGLPRFGASIHPSRRPMVEASFGEKVIETVERRRLPVTRVSPWETEIGSCHAIHFLRDGMRHGAADPRRFGKVGAA